MNLNNDPCELQLLKGGGHSQCNAMVEVVYGGRNAQHDALQIRPMGVTWLVFLSEYLYLIVVGLVRIKVEQTPKKNTCIKRDWTTFLIFLTKATLNGEHN